LKSSRRPREAWERTGTAWKAELLYGLVGGGISILVLSVAGWPDSQVASALIPIGSVLLAALLVPLAQFGWSLLWQPWHDLRTEVRSLSQGDSPMGTQDRLAVVLRDYLRQGKALEAMRNVGPAYETSEVEELEDWTHNIVQLLVEYGRKDQCERFIEADAQCGQSFGAHREWADARVAVLEDLIKELDESAAP
jgi:hypothetical protein